MVVQGRGKENMIYNQRSENSPHSLHSMLTSIFSGTISLSCKNILSDHKRRTEVIKTLPTKRGKVTHYLPLYSKSVCRKKRIKFAPMSSPCWSFFPTSKELSTRNSNPLVKLSIASFTVRFWSGWGRALGPNVQTSGKTTIGFSTTTTHPLTHHSLFDNSWLPKTLQWFPSPPIRLTSPPATYSYSPRRNYSRKGVVLTRLRRSMQNRKGYRQTHIWDLPGMHEIMGNTLGSLYTRPRGLLRRRRWKLEVTVSNFFMVKCPEVLGSTTYINKYNVWAKCTGFYC
jgi:hypothetical protein